MTKKIVYFSSVKSLLFETLSFLVNMITVKKTYLFLLLAFGSNVLLAQKYDVNKNTHSHNDYSQFQPFYTAYANHFASIEVDVFLVDNELYVAHNRADIDKKRTIESLYLEPLMKQIALNDNKPYKKGSLQLLIDLKTAGEPTLRCLEAKLKPLRQYFDVKNNPNAVRLVISGAIPKVDRYQTFDEIFYFDGNANIKYTPEQFERVAFYSTPLQRFTKWNGLGRMVEKDYAKVSKFVDSIHALGKKIRFWGNPDTKTCWQTFIKLGVDYLNTDSPPEMAKFLNTYESNSYTGKSKTEIYKPSYKSDAAKIKPKNVILLISDGAGFSQVWAAATANGGYLNVMNFKHQAYANTTSVNDYNTDSAAGATAMSTGEKTNNRYIGMDSTGKKIPNLVELLSAKGMHCGIVTNDLVTGATPAAFFAHRTDRDMSDSIASDLLNSPASLVIGGEHDVFKANQGALINKIKSKGFEVTNEIGNLNKMPLNKQVICFDTDRPQDNFRMIETAFDESVKFLSADHKKGFFLMVEGAKIDAGGHANKFKQAVDEYLSFDKVVGKALQFADKDGETLVIVTSDHETGGLILLDGNYKTGSVLGTFTTNDHTGLPVPLFSYGPGSDHFAGFVQNTDIPKKVMELLK